MEEKCNEYENEMKTNEKQRNNLIKEINQIDEQFSLFKEIIEQRNEILSDKVRCHSNLFVIVVIVSLNSSNVEIKWKFVEINWKNFFMFLIIKFIN